MEDEEIIRRNIQLMKLIRDEFTEKGMEPQGEVVLAIYENVCKDGRMIQISKERSERRLTGQTEGASAKQLAFLARRNIPHVPEVTKAAASELIANHLNKK